MPPVNTTGGFLALIDKVIEAVRVGDDEGAGVPFDEAKVAEGAERAVDAFAGCTDHTGDVGITEDEVDLDLPVLTFCAVFLSKIGKRTGDPLHYVEGDEAFDVAGAGANTSAEEAHCVPSDLRIPFDQHVKRVAVECVATRLGDSNGVGRTGIFVNESKLAEKLACTEHNDGCLASVKGVDVDANLAVFDEVHHQSGIAFIKDVLPCFVCS